jgi:hypothetical protein
MKEVTLTQLVAGTKAMMKVGSPVRMWMRRLRDDSRLLTPLPYIPQSDGQRDPANRPEYVEVEIVKVMLPYAIAYHHDGRGWARLWFDTREVPLYAPCD